MPPLEQQPLIQSRFVLEEVKRPEINDQLIGMLRHFHRLCEIPHGSGQEAGVSNYLTEIAKANGWTHKRDDSGNLLILVPPSRGLDKLPGIILQGHMDMVGVPSDPVINPDLHGVKAMTDDGVWLRGDGTSLGADNGFGLATMLSLAQSEDLEHGPLALLFTVQEETSMEGAKNFGLLADLQGYSRILNMDSEKMGEATIGGAGGAHTNVKLTLEREKPTDDLVYMSVCVSGCQGGHSGLKINRNHVNPIKIMMDIAKGLDDPEARLRLVSLTTSNAKKNAIPQDAQMVIAVPQSEARSVEKALQQINTRHDKVFFPPEETNISYSYAVLPDEQTQQAENIPMTVQSTQAVIDLLSDLRHGVIDWIGQEGGDVRTSTNLAIVKTDSGTLDINIMSRSADAQKLRDYIDSELPQIAGKYRASVNTPDDPYPAWEPDFESPILTAANAVHKVMFGKDIVARVTHGGLECAYWQRMFPHETQIISIGPTIQDPHTPQEIASLPSAMEFFLYSKELIKYLTSRDNS